MKKYAVEVRVNTRYLPDQSEPDANRYAFAYTVEIQNTGTVPAQLVSRHWIVTDAEGRRQEVKGLGVVGHQPLLAPGEKFEYTSGTPLRTPTGRMEGSYFFVAEDGERFDVAIEAFTLEMKRTLH